MYVEVCTGENLSVFRPNLEMRGRNKPKIESVSDRTAKSYTALLVVPTMYHDEHNPVDDEQDFTLPLEAPQTISVDTLSPPSQTSYVRPRRPTRALPPLPSHDDVIQDDVEDSPAQAEPAPSSSDTSPASDLTAIRAHYLKKSLIQLQFNHELDAITGNYPSNISTLSFLGQPFTPPPRDARPFLDLPFLRFIFRQFVLTFPFMAAAPRDFYSEKLQPFVTSALSRNMSPTSILDDDDNDGEGRSEQATRKKLLTKIERSLSMFLSSATKLVEREEVVRLNQVDLDRLEALAKRRMAKGGKEKVIFEVNVIGVRTVVDKGRMRSRAHEVRKIHSGFHTCG